MAQLTQKKPNPVYEISETVEGICIRRNSLPRLIIKVEDECTDKQLSDALAKAAEYIKKRSKYGERR